MKEEFRELKHSMYDIQLGFSDLCIISLNLFILIIILLLAVCSLFSTKQKHSGIYEASTFTNITDTNLTKIYRLSSCKSLLPKKKNALKASTRQKTSSSKEDLICTTCGMSLPLSNYNLT